jgi:hypothetical protein
VIRAQRYEPAFEDSWNRFVEESRNGTFLIDRRYMEYHSDRFDDHSLLLLDEQERLVAVLPAHRRGTDLVSHGGLTYGGFVSGRSMTLELMQQCFAVVRRWMREEGMTRFLYKTIPHMYHRQPAEEDLHALFLAGATVYRRDVLLARDNEQPFAIQERRRRALKKAQRAALVVEDSDDFRGYWAILTENLRSKYDTDPVHTLSEIELLATRFPEQIRLTVCRDGERILAGIVAYLSQRVAHLQYIGSTQEGRELGALDAVIDHLITRHQGVRWFDFGAATEQDGRFVNNGLLEYKEAWGARTIVHDAYVLEEGAPA